MSRKEERLDDWRPCAPGELVHLAARLDAHHRLRRGKQLINRAVAVLVIGASALLVVGAFTRDRLPPLTCAECRSHFAEYHLHQLNEQPLDDQSLAQRMADHLARCEHCRAKFLAAYPDARLGAAPPGGAGALLAAASWLALAAG
jgi:hypothetical protein